MRSCDRTAYGHPGGHTTKSGAGRICGADVNDDNLRISTAYLRISDHCRVRVIVRIRVRVTVRVMVRVRIKVRIRVRFRVANCCIQTAGEEATTARECPYVILLSFRL